MTSTSPSVSSATCGFMISSSPADSGSSFSSLSSSSSSSGFSSSFSSSSSSLSSSSLLSPVTLVTSSSSFSSLPQPAINMVATINRILSYFMRLFTNDSLLLIHFIIRIERHVTPACRIGVTAFGNNEMDTLYRYKAYYYTILQKDKSVFRTRSLASITDNKQGKGDFNARIIGPIPFVSSYN